MDIYGIFFTISILSILAITTLKIYNLVEEAKFYSTTNAILLFCGFMIAWLFGLVAFLNSPTEKIYHIFFIFSSVVMGLNVAFLGIELIFSLKTLIPKNQQQFNAQKHYADLEKS